MEGILLVDKPQDWTSHDVCAFVRKRFKIKKVGHAGTLDPLATGLLVLLLGNATKQSNALSSNDKVYEGIFQLGSKTDSHDLQGKVIQTAECGHVTLEEIRKTAKKFTGEIEQVPPMVSALKHKGVRLYQLARKGVDVHRDARKITVHKLEIISKEDNRIQFSAHVSKGTYVRTLVNDMGEAMGCFGFLAELRRTRSGEYAITSSVTVDDLKKMTPEELSGKILPVPPVASYANLHGA